MTWAPERLNGAHPQSRDPALGEAPYPHGAAAAAGRTRLELLRSLRTGPRGLTEAQAEERLLRYGGNAQPERSTPSWWRRFAAGVRDPFTAVLLGLALVSAAIASWGPAVVTLVLVMVSCALRAAGERRADRSAAALGRLIAATASVQRRPAEGAEPCVREVPVDELVPGDVVRLGPGDVVPADLRLLRTDGLTVQQAPLTGETRPAAKRSDDVPVAKRSDDVPVAKRSDDPAAGRSAGAPTAGQGLLHLPHLCFRGSTVEAGSGLGVVVATGPATQLAGGRSGPAERRRAPAWRRTAFDRSVHGIAWILIRFMLLTPPLVLMSNAALRDRGLEMLPFAIAVAVSLTPEMLPVIVTTVLARGAAGLARDHDVIVRRLSALHDLGAMDVLCVDKTGTLTENRPAVACHLDALGAPDESVLHWAAVNSLWTLQLADPPAPDALDDAILAAAPPDVFDAYEGIAALPYDPARRLATAVVRAPHGPARSATAVIPAPDHPARTDTLVVKGAVEDVLERCTRFGGGELDTATRTRLAARAAGLSGDGLRLLGVATADRPARLSGRYTHADERDLTFLGFLGLRDAPTGTAADALADLAGRGVAVKVLTGDHPATAARACRDLALPPGAVITAEAIDALTDAELAELARTTTVFARCTPAHKARIVAALGRAGHVTGYLGDGINDLPALHAADVGITPRGGVAVAREQADAVLAAKDLTALGHAITAGRHAGGNIANYLRITLSSDFGNVIAMLTAGLLLPFLPMLPVQVLVQNLCFDAAQLSLAYDRPAPAVLRRPTRLVPRDFLRFITGFGVLNAAADITTFAILAWSVHRFGEPGDGQAAFHGGWFTENLLTQALVMLLLRTATAQTRAPRPVWLAVGALAAIGILLPLTPLGPVLGMTSLPPVYYALLAVVLGLYATALAFAGRRRARREAEAARQEKKSARGAAYAG
ncbi:magnesium-translocating P-type ATPase [Streptomyces boninensis]|uniref:magnesium-translocating P-type ATPase n=1 Tax=Streptomyces boninensis TaxID=2039455 RepID=UPI003B21437C